MNDTQIYSDSKDVTNVLEKSESQGINGRGLPWSLTVTNRRLRSLRNWPTAQSKRSTQPEPAFSASSAFAYFIRQKVVAIGAAAAQCRLSISPSGARCFTFHLEVASLRLAKPKFQLVVAVS
jgi:hypothetical protein